MSGTSFGSRKVLITYEKIKIIAFAFLFLPLFLFLLFFIKLYISLPCMGIFIFAFIWINKKKGEKESDGKQSQGTSVNIWVLILIGFICVIWCYLGGHGGFFYQSEDWFARNAIFRDLITYRWPPYYNVTDSILCYYVGHWLPAAAVGRGLFLITGNLDIAWTIGNILLGIWTSLGCYISILLLIVYAKPQKTRFIILLVFLMIFFSGLDIIGWFKNGYNYADILNYQHIEWWQFYPKLQFSSNTTCLYWVFNQSTAAWVGTLCFLNEKDTRNYGFIIVCSMVSSILPSIGLAFIMLPVIALQFFKSVKAKTIVAFIKNLFSIQNIVYIVLVVPILYFYYSMNLTLNNNAAQSLKTVPYKKIIALCLFALILIILYIVLKIKNIKIKGSVKLEWMIGIAFVAVAFAVSGALRSRLDWKFFWFLLLEVGIYFIILFPRYYLEPIYYIVASILIIIPSIQVGTNSDFCMRASIPGLIILMAMCGKKLIEVFDTKVLQNYRLINIVTGYILIIVLIIGAVTPVVEIWRGIHNCIESGTVMLTNDFFYTMNRFGENGTIPSNFVSINYKETIFYNFLMR